VAGLRGAAQKAGFYMEIVPLVQTTRFEQLAAGDLFKVKHNLSCQCDGIPCNGLQSHHRGDLGIAPDVYTHCIA
jgi:hypothetical protein